MPPLWYRAAKQEWSFLDDSTPYSKEILDLPLGMIAGTSYRQTGVQLEAGDLLLLYTDGISESCDESGEQLGLDRLAFDRAESAHRLRSAAGQAPAGCRGASFVERRPQTTMKPWWRWNARRCELVTSAYRSN